MNWVIISSSVLICCLQMCLAGLFCIERKWKLSYAVPAPEFVFILCFDYLIPYRWSCLQTLLRALLLSLTSSMVSGYAVFYLDVLSLRWIGFWGGHLFFLLFLAFFFSLFGCCWPSSIIVQHISISTSSFIPSCCFIALRRGAYPGNVQSIVKLIFFWTIYVFGYYCLVLKMHCTLLLFSVKDALHAWQTLVTCRSMW